MLKCEQFASKVSDYVDDKLPGNERASMWVHGMICGHCRRYLKQIRAVINLTGELSSKREESREECPEATKQVLVEALRNRADPPS